MLSESTSQIRSTNMTKESFEKNPMLAGFEPGTFGLTNFGYQFFKTFKKSASITSGSSSKLRNHYAYWTKNLKMPISCKNSSLSNRTCALHCHLKFFPIKVQTNRFESFFQAEVSFTSLDRNMDNLLSQADRKGAIKSF